MSDSSIYPLRTAIVDYDAGNLSNVEKALRRAGCGSVVVADDPSQLDGVDALVIPGVGAFQDGMCNLARRGLDEAIRGHAGSGKPILGICLGMQVVAETGQEGGLSSGLGLLPMRVERLRSEEYGLRVPHIGWNDVRAAQATTLFQNLPPAPDFYFVHSYHVVCDDASLVAGTCHYGHEFTAAVERGNIVATQFHPEKSQRYGLVVLRNFLAFAAARARALEAC